MVRRRKFQALILSRRNMGEADRLLTLFTREQGLLRVYAKGVRRIPSRRGGQLEPLTHVVAIVSGRAGHYYLAAAEVADDFQSLHRDHEALARLDLVAQVITRLFHEDEAHEQLFDAVRHAAAALVALPPERQVLVEVSLLWLALHDAGLTPQLQQCRVCRTNRPDEAVILDAHDGGWRCLTCHASLAGTAHSLSPRLLRALQWVARYPHRAHLLRIERAEASQLDTSVREYVAAAVGTMSRPAAVQSQGA